MFMFVFSVLVISIIGLFFQVVNALSMAFAMQQTGLGQQLISWHNMAYEYACSSPAIVAEPVGGATLVPTAAQIKAMRQTSATNTASVYTGVEWNTIIFNGAFVSPDTGAAGATTRFVVSYADAGQNYGGVPASEVGRQMRKMSIKNSMLPGVIKTSSGVKQIYISAYANSGELLTATVTNIPSDIPVGSNALVTIANCP